MCDTSTPPSLFARFACLQMCSASDFPRWNDGILVDYLHMVPSDGVLIMHALPLLTSLYSLYVLSLCVVLDGWRDPMYLYWQSLQGME